MNRNDTIRRLIMFIICLAVAAGVVVLLVSSGNSDVNADAAKNYVMENHAKDTSAGNPVTAVYLNYRFWDTLFESLILIVSVLAVINLSWSGTGKGREDE